MSLSFVLGACTGMTVKEQPDSPGDANRDRAERLGELDSWGFTGRISLDDGEQGGSGNLQWRVVGDERRLDFHAAMGRGAWRLESGAAGAVLTQADGSVHEAQGVNELIWQFMGWPIPVDALQWWVRGLAAPGEIDELELDAHGMPVVLKQAGWQVEYGRYRTVAGLALPLRLKAWRENYRVKLAVSQWSTKAEMGAPDQDR